MGLGFSGELVGDLPEPGAGGNPPADEAGRINMKFDSDTGMPKKAEFYDFSKKFRNARYRWTKTVDDVLSGL